MRKVLCVLTVLVLCVSMVLPAFAAENGFVPSITYKPNPELVEVIGEDGNEYIGVVRNEDGEIISYLDMECLRITPIAHVWDEEMDVPEDVEQLLLMVYEALNTDAMEIPYEKHNANLDPDNMVIRDLFDARWSCEDHPKMLLPEGVVLELTFDLGVVADAEIFVQTYDEDTKEWSPIVKAVNNGDGTVTCTFEHLCAIAFSMPLAKASAAAVTEVAETPNVLPWVIILIASACAVVGFIVVKSKKKTAV